MCYPPGIRTVKKLLKSEFLRHAGVVVGGSQVVNALNLAYHLLVVRLLDVETYGVLNSVVALTLYFGQLTLPFQPVLARFFARCRELGDPARILRGVRSVSLMLGTASLAIFLFFLFGAGFLARQQNLNDPGYMVLAGALVAVAIFGVVPQAFLQGSQMFSALAGLTVAAAAGKLLVGAGSIALGAGAAGGMAGYISGPLLLAGAGYWLIARWGRREGVAAKDSPPVPLAPICRHYLPTALFLVSFALLTNFDVNLVKKFFSPEEAGYYSVAQMVGKIVFYLPGGIAVVVFPKAAAAQAGKRASRHLLVKGLGTAGALGLIGVAAAAAAPRFLLRLLTGKDNPASVELVFAFALAMFFYSLAWTAGFYNLSLHRMRFVPAIFLLAVLQAAAIALHHPGLPSVVSILAVGGFLTMLVCVGFAWGEERETSV